MRNGSTISRAVIIPNLYFMVKINIYLPTLWKLQNRDTMWCFNVHRSALGPILWRFFQRKFTLRSFEALWEAVVQHSSTNQKALNKRNSLLAIFFIRLVPWSCEGTHNCGPMSLNPNNFSHFFVVGRIVSLFEKAKNKQKRESGNGHFLKHTDCHWANCRKPTCQLSLHQKAVWPDKNRQMSVKVAQKWFH